MEVRTDCGTFYYETSADCCSESWFAEILGFDRLIGEEVTSWRLVQVDCKEDNKTRQYYDKFYGFELITKKGSCLFVYRNSSNGYYFGWCNRYPEQRIKERKDLIFRKIEDDWEA